jgi:hypothetical protein
MPMVSAGGGCCEAVDCASHPTNGMKLCGKAERILRTAIPVFVLDDSVVCVGLKCLPQHSHTWVTNTWVVINTWVITHVTPRGVDFIKLTSPLVNGRRKGVVDAMA